MEPESRNTVLVVLGMAGSGKSTFCHRLYAWISEKHLRLNRNTGLNDEVFGVNLDPAAISTKMPLHYDIREKVDIHDLMLKKKLGPNGAILTALNLFVAQIDGLISQIDSTRPRYTIIDTPGQIEMFTTSVSGEILVRCFSQDPKTDVRLLYVVDGERGQSPQCFISNMLFATSVLYRYGQSVHVIVNKADVEGAEVIEKWVRDLDIFMEQLKGTDFITPFVQSLALWLDEFYNALPIHYISSATGSGKQKVLGDLFGPENEEVEKIAEALKSAKITETRKK